MKKILFPFLVLLLISGINSLFGQTSINSIRFGSTGDPLNGLSIAWNSTGTADKISWGYTADLEKGEFETIKTSSVTGTRFEYTFPTVTAGATINYALFDSNDNEWTENHTYKVASNAPNNQFSFTVLGDSRSNPGEWRTISDATLDTDFTLFMGDIISDGSVASDWRAWFQYGEKFISREVIYHCVGNHDDDNSPSGFDNFLGLYTLPGNELYYTFNYGNAVFICLNSENASDPEQYNWLKSTLETNKDKTWKIVFFHKPFYTAPSHTGEMDGYFSTWWKTFDEYGVDMIFNGHTHNYQRTKPINRDVSTNSGVANYGNGDGQGRCQIVAGNAGAPLSAAASSSLWWLDNSVSKRHFCNIDIDGDKLTMKAMDANNVVFDELILDKSNSEITFEVDLDEVTDLYEGGKVWLNFADPDTSYVMTDTDGDNIYTFKVDVEIEKNIQYFFSYQNGANAETDVNNETVPSECSDNDGYRTLTSSYGNYTLPAVLFGTCNKAPADVDITFEVDLNETTDLYSGGSVWLHIANVDNPIVMTDNDGDNIYSVTLTKKENTDINYFFSYQSGANPESDFVEENLPAECGDDAGMRFLKVPGSDIVLPAFLFNTCSEAIITNLSVPIAADADDAEEVASVLRETDVLGEVDLTSSDLELCIDHSPQIVGLLFRNLAIPARATITEAYVTFTEKKGAHAGGVKLNVFAAKEANVEAIFETNFFLSSQTPTSTVVEWTLPAIGAVNETFVTNNIGSVIEEVVGIDGWASGNNILLLIRGDDTETNEKNNAEPFSAGNAAVAPVLTVEFDLPNASNTIKTNFSSKVYPNPTNGILNIENPSSKEFSYEIYSLSGKMVLSRSNLTGSSAKVDMSGLQGMYIVKVLSSEKSALHKVIVQ